MNNALEQKLGLFWRHLTAYISGSMRVIPGT